MKYDPKRKHFDPYECWEKVDCEHVDEMTYEDENGEVVYDGLFCNAPYDFECPLYKNKIEKDLQI